MTQQVFNLDWFAGNESVKYPIDSKVSFIPEGYTYIPSGLMGAIVDISFSIPSTLTGIPYLSAITITDDIFTLVISCGDSPLFVFSSAQRALHTSTFYDLRSFVSGASGVIVFGSGAKTHRGAYKFSEDQATFLPSVYHRYQAFPVSSFGVEGRTSHTGDIQFKGLGDVEVTTDTIRAEGRSVKAIIFRLNKEENPESLQRYLGPCDVRPESDTCGRSSIQSINGVVPDSNGNINIIGENLAVSTTEGQLILGSGYALEDVCIKDKILNLIGENYCPKEEEEEEEDEGSQCSSAKLINFDTDIEFEGDGISIDASGITPTRGEIALNIAKLSNIRYLSVRVTRPEDGGYCSISYGTSTVTINSENAVWGKEYTLYDSDTSTYPHRVEVTIDHCNGFQSLWGDGKKIMESNCGIYTFSPNITFKGCTIAAIKYRNERL